MFLRSVFALCLLLAGLCAMAEGQWSDRLRFFGRWDLRTAGRAVTVNSGSYVLVHFSGAGLVACFDVTVNQPPLPTLTWRIDDGAWQEAEVAPTVTLADGLAKGKHTVMLMARGMDEHQSRWKAPLTASLTFTGFTLPKGGRFEKALKAWDHPALTMEFLGDSITEGVLVQGAREGKKTWAWLTDARNNYACRTAMALGAPWRQVGFGATGLQHGGSGGAVGALHSFNFFYADCPRDTWQPDVVVINQGTNDGGMPAKDYQPLYARYLAMIRAAYPKAKIAAMRPFNGAQAAAIKAAVDAAADPNIVYIDTTDWYTGPLHPTADGSAPLAENLVQALKATVLAKK
jgi:lysophospholipase L1-like esterase